MFNFFDLFILVITVGYAIGGFREGLVRGIIKLAGLAGTIIILAVLADEVSSLAERLPIAPEFATPLTFFLLFALSMVALHFVAESLHALIHMTPAGFVDSGLGTAFGLLKALIMGGLLAMLISYLPRDSFLYNQYAQSATAAPLHVFFEETIPYVMDAGRSIYNRYHPTPEPVPENDEREDNQYSI